ncbi:CBM Family 18/Carbohydrate Esterase Family 4 protein [Gigaspora rosea]|uniref:CBM Family 18/Carbohydrate Esterase Family 4 protein n=1 Tax=Gigaspora rosea TaxID=44941 RepID=A0A397W5X4_9GLOM|nr:CBM Family 18/Carbohydrate Esterase Family 4 protein [Gigaspora rosea]
MARIIFLFILLSNTNILYVFSQFSNPSSYRLSPDATCGGLNGTEHNFYCPNYDCCSKNGFCGGTTAHCGVGCQPDYGVCGIPNDGLTSIETCKTNNTLALSLDDGLRPWTNHALAALNESGIKASFFVNGHNEADFCIYDHAEILQRIYKEGHLIGAHTWSHVQLGSASPDEIDFQLDTLDLAIRRILGVKLRYFRHPFGESVMYPYLRKALIRRGYKYIALWDVDTRDWATDLETARQSFPGLISDLKPHISLMHDRINTTVDSLLPYAIDTAKKLGYEFDTIPGCNGQHNKSDWYQVVGKPEKRDYKTWHCNPSDMNGGVL